MQCYIPNQIGWMFELDIFTVQPQRTKKERNQRKKCYWFGFYLFRRVYALVTFNLGWKEPVSDLLMRIFRRECDPSKNHGWHSMKVHISKFFWCGENCFAHRDTRTKRESRQHRFKFQTCVSLGISNFVRCTLIIFIQCHLHPFILVKEWKIGGNFDLIFWLSDNLIS